MKYTLLDMVQTVLSSIDGDTVNSINDTEEALQVAYVIRTCFEEVKSRADLPEHYGLFTLNATSTSTPTVMTKPSAVSNLKWIKYDTRTITETVPNWQVIQYMSPEEFIDMTHNYDHSQSDISSFTFTSESFNSTIYYINDKAPQYWTTFDEYNLIFDSIDTGIDSNIQSSKTSCYGRLLPVFSMTDSYTMDLDDDEHHLLLNESKSLAWAELKQSAHQKAEKKARQAWIKVTKDAQDLPKGDKWRASLPDYGRKR